MHCCTDDNNGSNKAICPANGQTYSRVNRRTVIHQVCRPWQRELTAQHYFFCDDPDCEVVYFGDDAQVISRNEVRQIVGQKSTAPDKPVCYCFGILLTDLQTKKDRFALKTYVTEQTRNATCDCEIRNPSGKCCLPDFPNDE